MTRSQKITVLILCFLIAILVLSVVILINRKTNFEPPKFDENAENIPKDLPNGYGVVESETLNFTFGLCGKVKCDNKKSNIFFVNPAKNNANLKLRIYNKNGKIIYETGLIKPSECIKSVPLDLAAYPAPLYAKIMAYEPNTYHSLGHCYLGINVDN